MSGGSPTKEEAGEAADTPVGFELAGRRPGEVDPGIVTGVEDHRIGRRYASPPCKGSIEEPLHVAFVGRIHHDGLRRSALRDDRVRNGVDFRGRPSANEDVVPRRCEPTDERRAKTVLRANPDDDRAGARFGSFSS